MLVEGTSIQNFCLCITYICIKLAGVEDPKRGLEITIATDKDSVHADLRNRPIMFGCGGRRILYF